MSRGAFRKNDGATYIRISYRRLLEAEAIEADKNILESQIKETQFPSLPPAGKARQPSFTYVLQLKDNGDRHACVQLNMQNIPAYPPARKPYLMQPNNPIIFVSASLTSRRAFNSFFLFFHPSTSRSYFETCCSSKNTHYTYVRMYVLYCTYMH